MNRNEQIVFSGHETEKKISIIGLVQGAEGLVIKKFNEKDNEKKLPNEIIVAFDEIKNLAAKEGELDKEEIEAIIKFLSDKEYKIETNEEGKEFKIKMPEKLKGY